MPAPGTVCLILALNSKLAVAAPFFQGDLERLRLPLLHGERLQKSELLDDRPPALLPPDLQQQLDVCRTRQYIFTPHLVLIQHPSFLGRHTNCVSGLIRCFPGNVRKQRMDLPARSGAFGFNLCFRFNPAARFQKRIDRQAQTITSPALVHLLPIDCRSGDVQIRYPAIGVHHFLRVPRHLLQVLGCLERQCLFLPFCQGRQTVLLYMLQLVKQIFVPREDNRQPVVVMPAPRTGCITEIFQINLAFSI
ncbi:hypothetical protein D3C74_334370 [compost metagenome]